MIYEDCWLPDLFECKSLGDGWPEYEQELYDIFIRDFVVSHPTFQDKPVRIRKHPLEGGRENAFWHVICKDYHNTGERQPDLRRCERIEWIRAFIENYDCNKPHCVECPGMLVWTSYSGGPSNRLKIFLEEKKYVVILEVRKNYVLLITAYYLDYPHSAEKLKRDYLRAKAESAT